MVSLHVSSDVSHEMRDSYSTSLCKDEMQIICICRCCWTYFGVHIFEIRVSLNLNDLYCESVIGYYDLFFLNRCLSY